MSMPLYGKMNPEAKALWVAALRSGEYNQGKSYLHTVSSDEYCCLGVLCDLAAKAGVLTKIEDRLPSPSYGSSSHPPVIRFYGDAEDLNAEFLPRPVMAWAGLGTRNPSVDIMSEYGNGEEIQLEVQLADLNDDREWSFNQIADTIEEQF